MKYLPTHYDEIDEKTRLLYNNNNNNNDNEPVQVKKVYGVRRSSILLTVYVLFYFFYLMTGGLTFAILETPAENELRNSVLKARDEFLDRFPTVKDEALEELIEKVVAASNRGVSAAKNVSGEPNWSFGQSLFFSSTVVTTIGYGHVTPLSKAGKIFCMIYAMIGIPLTLMLLTALVERIMVPATLFLQYLNSKLGHLYQPFNIRLLHLFLVVSILVTLFLFIPAAIFAALEPEWDYLDSLYYCFISLTTIGLGDYIPGDSPNQPYRPLYKVLTTCYLLVGLIFMMLTLTIFYDIPQLNFGLFFLMRSDETQQQSTTIDPEKVRLQTPGAMGPKYTQQMDITQTRHSVIKVKTRRDDSPSPEDTTPVHARP